MSNTEMKTSSTALASLSYRGSDILELLWQVMRLGDCGFSLVVHKLEDGTCWCQLVVSPPGKQFTFFWGRGQSVEDAYAEMLQSLRKAEPW